jgi:hypothetical protein
VILIAFRIESIGQLVEIVENRLDAGLGLRVRTIEPLRSQRILIESVRHWCAFANFGPGVPSALTMRQIAGSFAE